MAILKLQQQNIAAAAAYTEYSVAIPPRATELTLALRPGGSSGAATPANLFWYTASHPNAGNIAADLPSVYNTIPLQSSRTIRGLVGGQTIYFQTDQADQLLEVDYYADV